MNTLEFMYFGAIRFILPIVALLLLFVNIRLILHNLKRKTLAKFAIESYRDVVNIKSSECLIGSSLICDVRLKSKKVAKQHALLNLTEYGFKLTPLSPHNKIYVNDYEVQGEAFLQSGDKIRIGDVQLQIAINPAISTKSIAKNDKSAKSYRLCAGALLSVFQLISACSLSFTDTKNMGLYFAVFGGMIILEWIYFLIRGFKSNIGIETTAFFLTTVGLCMAANVKTDVILKQGIMFLVGFFGFIILSLLLKKLKFVEAMRIPVMAIGGLLLIYNMFFGVYINGSRNWIAIGDFTLQPSEFVKVAFVFISACSLDKLIKTKDLLTFLGFMFICLCSLAIMRDFGTAIIYFDAMIIILCLRLCDTKIVIALLGSAGVLGALVVKFIPYISARFATYLHAWDYATSGGYQQTQTMISVASGGLFGMGLGQGNLSNVSAADTDLVFGMVSEELGLIFALCIALMYALFMIYTAVCIPRTRSIYYAVTASAAAGIYIFQATLNIFGSLDLLPLTGVTLPFVSNGGSSMIAAWLLLAFIKCGGTEVVSLKAKESDE